MTSENPGAAGAGAADACGAAALAGCERVLVVGNSGSGKSTLSRALAERLGLPAVHLDTHFWLPGWTEPDQGAWRRRVEELVAAPRWVMDGNFGGTLPARVARAQAVVLLDLPTPLCLARILKRWRTWRGRSRPDLPEGCPEHIDLRFMAWVTTFRWRDLPRVHRALAEAPDGQRQLVLRSRAEVARLLAELEGAR